MSFLFLFNFDSYTPRYFMPSAFSSTSTRSLHVTGPLFAIQDNHQWNARIVEVIKIFLSGDASS